MWITLWTVEKHARHLLHYRATWMHHVRENGLICIERWKIPSITTTVSSIPVMYYATPLCGRAILLKAACARKLCANRGYGMFDRAQIRYHTSLINLRMSCYPRQRDESFRFPKLIGVRTRHLRQLEREEGGFLRRPAKLNSRFLINRVSPAAERKPRS